VLITDLLVVFVSFCDFLFFFFSSRRRHTRSYGDWSSDVCSSDLSTKVPRPQLSQAAVLAAGTWWASSMSTPLARLTAAPSTKLRSEERRVGKECRSRRGPYQ